MWDVTESSGDQKLLKSVDSLKKARKYAESRWPGCYFEGDPDQGAKRVEVVLDESTVGYLRPATVSATEGGAGDEETGLPDAAAVV
jgi:hypothetical protein